MSKSQLRYIQRCLRAVCDASTDTLLRCNAADLKKARKNLESTLTPKVIGPDLPSSCASAAKSTLIPVIIDDSGPVERNPSAATSICPLPEPEGRDRELSPVNDDNIELESISGTVEPQETFICCLLSREERVRLLVQRNPNAALGLSQPTAVLDYKRLVSGLDEDKYRGHHAIVWTYDQYKQSALSMADYVSSLELSPVDSKRLLKMLGDGRKLHIIDDGFRKRFAAKVTGSEDQLEHEPSRNAEVEGALVPWLTFHYKMWSRMPVELIPHFLDLCIINSKILEYALETSKFYRDSKLFYRKSNVTHFATDTQLASLGQGEKRKRSSLEMRRLRSTNSQKKARGILQSSTETNAAQRTFETSSWDFRTNPTEAEENAANSGISSSSISPPHVPTQSEANDPGINDLTRDHTPFLRSSQGEEEHETLIPLAVSCHELDEHSHRSTTLSQIERAQDASITRWNDPFEMANLFQSEDAQDAPTTGWNNPFEMANLFQSEDTQDTATTGWGGPFEMATLFQSERAQDAATTGWEGSFEMAVLFQSGGAQNAAMTRWDGPVETANILLNQDVYGPVVAVSEGNNLFRAATAASA